MLTHIQIRNFAIIGELDLEISPNLSVITGETGAGKSIVLDALSLAMGQRADAGAVRHGSDKAEILASFELDLAPLAQQWLNDRELDSENHCILRRVVSKDGRSRGYINGRSSTLQDLKDLGSLLINIHGQHEHQALLKKDTHRRLLDNFAKTDSLAKTTATTYRQWQLKRDYLDKLKTRVAENGDRAELLHYQVQELASLNLMEGELKKLEEEHKLLANAEQNQANCHHSLAILNDLACEKDTHSQQKGEAVAITDLLGQAIRHLEQCIPQNETLKQSIELINNALIQTEEAADSLRHYLDSFNSDPARYQALDERLSSIYQLARKHKIPAEQMVTLHQQLAEELESLSGGDEKLEALENECTALQQEYVKIASKLSTKRASAAKKLSKAIGEQISCLGMPQGKCQVTLVPLDAGNYSSQGMESIEFLVTTNAGQPLKPLTKVASGGELSRISLAIQVICAEQSELGTIVFDEVDVGIGGGTAEVVGKLLRHLGKEAQVLCVTHLPQVAAQGHHHLHVNKQTKKKLTHTSITPLSNDEKVLEIARMLGGLEITDQTIAHAKEMVTSA
ncbi:MAG: DNA repair protein RecN [Pseudomonadales bacterium]|nr:DNA repair protein RecN [Pseudomonadales bacterium]